MAIWLSCQYADKVRLQIVVWQGHFNKMTHRIEVCDAHLL